MQVPFRASRARALALCFLSTALLGQSCPQEMIVGLNVTIEGDGQVTPCCAGVYKAGTVVHLSATPGLGYVFKQYRGNTGVGISTSPELDVLMDQSKNIVATFVIRPPNPDDLKST